MKVRYSYYSYEKDGVSVSDISSLPTDPRLSKQAAVFGVPLDIGTAKKVRTAAATTTPQERMSRMVPSFDESMVYFNVKPADAVAAADIGTAKKRKLQNPTPTVARAVSPASTTPSYVLPSAANKNITIRHLGYANSESMFWQISPPADAAPGQLVYYVVRFLVLDTEGNFDYVNVAPGGSDASSPSWRKNSGQYTSWLPSFVVGSTTGLTVWFISDGSTTFQGFELAVNRAPMELNAPSIDRVEYSPKTVTPFQPVTATVYFNDNALFLHTVGFGIVDTTALGVGGIVAGSSQLVASEGKFTVTFSMGYCLSGNYSMLLYYQDYSGNYAYHHLSDTKHAFQYVDPNYDPADRISPLITAMRVSPQGPVRPGDKMTLSVHIKSFGSTADLGRYLYFYYTGLIKRRSENNDGSVCASFNGPFLLKGSANDGTYGWNCTLSVHALTGKYRVEVGANNRYTSVQSSLTQFEVQGGTAFVSEPPVYDITVTPADARRTDVLNIQVNVTSPYGADWPSISFCVSNSWIGCVSLPVAALGNPWSKGDIYYGRYSASFDISYFIPEYAAFPASGETILQLDSCGRVGCSTQRFDNLIRLVGGTLTPSPTPAPSSYNRGASPGKVTAVLDTVLSSSVVRAGDILTVTATVANLPSYAVATTSIGATVFGLGVYGSIIPCYFPNLVQLSGNDSLAAFAGSCYIGAQVGGNGLINGHYTASVLFNGYDSSYGYRTVYGQPVPFQVVDAMDPPPGPAISDVTASPVVMPGSTVNISAVIVDPLGSGILPSSIYINVSARDIFVREYSDEHSMVPVSPYTGKYVGTFTVGKDVTNGVYTYDVSIRATSTYAYMQSFYHSQVTFTVINGRSGPPVSKPTAPSSPKAKAKRGSGSGSGSGVSASMHKSIGTFSAQSLGGLLGVCLCV